MLKDWLLRQLLIDPTAEQRTFVVSVSGGVDSMILLDTLAQLRSEASFSLKALHFNFHLRGEESDRDEAFVKAYCDRMGIEFLLVHEIEAPSSGQHEWTRLCRKHHIKTLPQNWEIFEAHQLDDQMETFFLKLFRGVGLTGVQGLKLKSCRDGRVLWRPLLGYSKSELLKEAERRRLSFCIDKSNQDLKYDRNWVRHKILPEVESRFPHFKRSILDFLEQIQEEEGSHKTELDGPFQILCGAEEWDWNFLLSMEPWCRKRLLHRYFIEIRGNSIGRRHLQDLNDALEAKKSFRFQLPKNLDIRGYWQSRMIEKSVIRIKSLGD